MEFKEMSLNTFFQRVNFTIFFSLLANLILVMQNNIYNHSIGMATQII